MTHPATSLGAAPATSQLARTLDTLDAFSDVVGGRVASAEPPAWCEARGWTEYLRHLTTAELQRAELDVTGWMLHAEGVPDSLRSFAAQAESTTRLEHLSTCFVRPALPERFVKERKLLQIEALLATLRELAEPCVRLLDVGSGKGHLSRIASARWVLAALGVDRNQDLLECATDLAAGGRAEYCAIDVLHEALPVHAADLVLGLHACGEVTDIALTAAVEARARVAFVSCCLQKVRSPTRVALSSFGRERGFSLSREVLGLSNLMGRAEGIEVAQSVSIEAHEARLGLRMLLAVRGIATLPGEEMRGVNRRRARKGFITLARESFDSRGLSPPTDLELVRAAAKAHEEHGWMRRWSLPRTLLPRVIECAVAFDRASFLEENGHIVRVAVAFPAEVSPRNVLVVGVPGAAIASR